LLQVTLEVGDEAARNKVSKALPRLKDAFIRDLYDYYAIQTPGRRGVNVEAIKRRLKRTADEVVGDGGVTKVLIQGAVERETGSN
ncbi:MAG: flagellar basal body-associated FliL family protein, partial [Pseudomonadota bacterium]